MNRITPVPYQTLVCVFELAGFKKVRQEGDHLVYTKPGLTRPVVIPCYKAVPEFIILNNLRTGAFLGRNIFGFSKEFRESPASPGASLLEATEARS